MLNFNRLRICPTDSKPQTNRSMILQEIRTIARERSIVSTVNKHKTNISKPIHLKLTSSIKPIRPIKKIHIAKPFSKLEKIKKRWDPNHTGLAWKA